MTYTSKLLLNSDVCKDSVIGTPLGDKCLCVQEFDAYARRTTDFEDQMVEYHNQLAARTKYLADDATWHQNYNYNRNFYESDLRYYGHDGYQFDYTASTCGGDCDVNFDSNRSLDKSWEPTGNWQYGYNHEQFPVCQNECKLTSQSVDELMDAWKYLNQAPSFVDSPTMPNIPSGDNIQCCVNIIQNVNANNIADINQKCSQSITEQITEAAGSMTTTPGPVVQTTELVVQTTEPIVQTTEPVVTTPSPIQAQIVLILIALFVMMTGLQILYVIQVAQK